MIEFYYWPTPNGWKPAIMLEECGLPYELKKENRKNLFGHSAKDVEKLAQEKN